MKKTIIIAEAGVNHNGRLSLAKKLIDGASIAGADYIKFQTYNVDLLVAKNASLAQYQKKNSKNYINQFSMLKKLQLSEENQLLLLKYAKKKKIKFLSSAFDSRSLKFLSDLKLDYFKVPSSEVSNIPYLRQLAKYNKKTILSTGMSSFNEIKHTVKVLNEAGLSKNKIFILQCNSEYPSPIRDSNIRAMVSMRELLGVKVGYSDHTIGIESSLCAVSLGASIIEKHITISKKLNGPDHAASASINEFKYLVEKIRNVEKSLGNFKKTITKSERKNKKNVIKYIFSKTKINKGEIFTSHNLLPLRSNKGISVANWDRVIGKKSKFDFKPGELIKI